MEVVLELKKYRSKNVIDSEEKKQDQIQQPVKGAGLLKQYISWMVDSKSKNENLDEKNLSSQSNQQKFRESIFIPNSKEIQQLQVEQQQSEDSENSDDQQQGNSAILEFHPSYDNKQSVGLMQFSEIKNIKQQLKEKQQDNDFDKIIIDEAPCSNKHCTSIQHQEHKYASEKIIELIKIREKYQQFKHSGKKQNLREEFVEFDQRGRPLINWDKELNVLPKLENVKLQTEKGIIYGQYSGNQENYNYINKIQDVVEYIKDYIYLQMTIHDKKVISAASNRISIISKRFEMHEILNHNKERREQQKIVTNDFFTVPTVDTHIHHSAAMSAKDLAQFLRDKFSDEKELEKIVQIDKKTGQEIKLREIMKQLRLDDPTEINVDSLNVQADRNLFRRFDNFNNKYNPQSSSVLREVFLKTDNLNKGEYLGQLTRQIMKPFEHQQIYQEWRLSIYGKSTQEWTKLSDWIFNNDLHRCPGSGKISWMIQIPRLYQIYKKIGIIENFQQMIDNIFQPLFDVTIDPSSNISLYRFSLMIGGFDSVDDESTFDHLTTEELTKEPSKWDLEKNPHYVYWMYYLYSNIRSLNYLRAQRGLNTFSFRPHCGEAGDYNHLISAFLLSDGINHGIQLQENAPLSYLFYLCNIGLAVSPLSNNKLFVKFKEQPFQKFFILGMNVSLSTDDPLILHMTNEPLMEEYAIASQLWDLTSVDQSEISRNSIKQSSFPEKFKTFWIGDYNKFQPDSNKHLNSNLPQPRFIFRLDCLTGELEWLAKYEEEENASSQQI